MKHLLLALAFAAPMPLLAAPSTVRASLFGFNPTNSTAALQAAINSGARRVIVENMGAPWITDKLQLASHQEIVFEKGVVVQALRGAFKGRNDSLFNASLKTNITLRGYGATLKMWKQDYDDPTQYTHAEWRHVLCFKSCSRVRILGLTLADSGGDGIYLGVAQRGVPCSDVLIRDVICSNNYRQGISVISARNLLIENCVLKDTGGTAPMAGIDFEPNHESEELVNCVMRNCVSENNRGSAYTFYLRPLRASSKPISIRIENCRAIGCRNSARFVTSSDSETAGVKGTMDFINCQFEGGLDGGVIVGDKPASGARVSFVNCQILHAATNKPATTPIQFSNRSTAIEDLGNIHFVNCVITDPLKRNPISYQDLSGGLGLRDITGTLIVNRTKLHLTPQRLAEWMPHTVFKRFPQFPTKGLCYEPVSATPKFVRCTARIRGPSEWLLWAEAGQEVAFTVQIRRVGKGEAKPSPVSIVSPSGKTKKLKSAEGEASYTFTASETGGHKIVCDPGKWTATVNSATHRVCLYSESARFHFLSTTGDYYFWVPPGTKDFAVKVSGEGDGERVKAALRDPEGNTVEEKDNIAAAHQFVARPKRETGGEIWSLRLDKPSASAMEDFHVQLQGIPPVLSPTKESLLKPSSKEK